jgi:hypothetical protein
MEDAHFFEETEHHEVIFGVLDGHNGRIIVEFVTKNLKDLLIKKLRQYDKNEDVSHIFNEVFIENDNMIFNEY